MFDNTWISEYYRMRRDIYIYKTVGRYKNIISNYNPTYYSRINSNPYLIANGRNTFVLSSIRLTYNHTFVDIAVTSDSCFWIDCNIIGMSKIKTPPQLADL